MKKSDIESLLLEYISGENDSEQQKHLEALLLDHGYTIRDLEELNDIYKNMDKILIPDPGQEMSEKFYSMLKNYKDDIPDTRSLFTRVTEWIGELNRPKYIPHLAYGLSLVIIGWLIGFWSSDNSEYKEQLDYLNNEIHELKTMMTINMLDQDSPSTRIKTLNQIKNLTDIDDATITALLYTLNNDPNLNVRLVTVEVLTRISDNNRVREGLIYSITQQESPLIQIALVDLMVGIKERAAIGQFKELLKKKDLNDVVRSRIEENLKILI